MKHIAVCLCLSLWSSGLTACSLANAPDEELSAAAKKVTIWQKTWAEACTSIVNGCVGETMTKESTEEQIQQCTGFFEDRPSVLTGISKPTQPNIVLRFALAGFSAASGPETDRATNDPICVVANVSKYIKAQPDTTLAGQFSVAYNCPGSCAQHFRWTTTVANIAVFGPDELATGVEPIRPCSNE